MVDAPDSPGEAPALTDDELARLRATAAGVPDATAAAFRQAVDAWRAVRQDPSRPPADDTRSYAVGPEADAVVALGDAAVPLAVAELPTPDGFFLLPLIERMTGRGDLVATAPENPRESQQSRARRTVRLLSA
jgi:hypothetical protein